jgi:hypothetical protein
MSKHMWRAAILNPAGQALSSVWQIWSVDNEIYVAAQSLTREFKSSLHSSGKHRHAFVSQEQADRHRMPGQDRAVFKWQHGEQSQDPSNALLFQILIPECGLRTNVDGLVGADVVSLPRPMQNEILVLSVLKEAGPESRVDRSRVLPLASWSLPTREIVQITSHTDPQTEEQMATWAEFVERNPIFSEPEAASVDEAGRFDLRAHILLDAADGVGRVLDFGIRELAMWASFHRLFGSADR